MPSGPRVLIVDIETAPYEAYVWALFDQNVGIDMIKTEWSILSFAAKWLDSEEVIYTDTGGRGRAMVRNDRALMKALWKLFDEADIVIGQNSRAFDIKKINARMIEHGLPPYSPFRQIDTMEEAKKRFAFSSNKLAWLSAHLTDTKKSEHKRFAGFSLWRECLADNPEAWLEMKHYNILDTLSTEELYLKLRPWIAAHANFAVFNDSLEVQCPRCTSTDIQRRGMAYTQTGAFHKVRCNQCGGWSRLKQNEATTAKRKSLLAG